MSLYCGVVLSDIFWLCNHLAEEERTGCLTLMMLFLSCDCFLLLPWVGLWPMIKAFPGHTQISVRFQSAIRIN